MIYFDNAATGFPKNASVAKAVSESIDTCGNPGRGGHGYSIRAAETVYECRKKLAAMFGTRPDLVVFTSGTTESLNIAVKGANRSGGVTVVSNLEHNSVMRPLNALRRRGETVVRQFRVDLRDDGATLENFRTVSRGATNVVITHASNVCGRILPVKDLRKNAPDDAIFILDAAQTAGHFGFGITDLGVDAICIPAHKGLYGPMGVGALIINPESDVYFESLIEGGTGTNSKSFDMPEQYPEHLEPGTQNVSGIAGLSAALDGFEYPSGESELFFELVKGLEQIDGITLYGAPRCKTDLKFYTPALLFNKRGYDCEELAAKLNENGIAVRAGYHCSPCAHRALGSFESGGVRVSPGRNNSKREVTEFLRVIKTL